MATRTCNIYRSACLFFCNTITGTVLSPWFVQLQRNKIQGLFMDKLQFSRSKMFSINWHSLTPFWTRYCRGLKHSMESSSAMVDHLSHYVVLLSVTTLLCKMSTVTGYDLQSEILPVLYWPFIFVSLRWTFSLFCTFCSSYALVFYAL